MQRRNRLQPASLVLLIGIVLVFSFLPMRQAFAAEETITRAEWIGDLVETFGIETDEEDYPDLYFTDITAESPAYDVVMCATDFGIVDIPSGQPFRPDDPVTREFAAETLNYCLGFQILDENFTYSDFADAAEQHRDDLQVAVNRGWFELTEGAVNPTANVTSTEIEAMLADAKAVLKSSDKFKTATTEVEFKDGVKVVPGQTEVSINEDETVVTIIDSPVDIAQGDIFAAYFNGYPAAFRAASVSVAGNTTTVTTADVDPADAFDKCILVADDNVDLAKFVPEEGVRAIVSGSNQNDQRIQLITNLEKEFGEEPAIVSAELSNVWASFYVDELAGTARVTLSGTATIKASIVALSEHKTFAFGAFEFAPAFLSINVDYGIEGKLSDVVQADFGVEAVYTLADGLRVTNAFCKGHNFIAGEAEGYVGLSARLGVGLVNTASLDVGIGLGSKIIYNRIPWNDGEKPYVCENLEGHLYAEVFSTFVIKGDCKEKEPYPIWNEDNSPVRASVHREDDVEVPECTRGLEFGGTYDKFGLLGDGSTYWELDADGRWNAFAIYEYTVDENGDATITKYYGVAFALVIPDTLGGHPVVGIGNDVFKDDPFLMSVQIPDTVRNIGGRAFSGCKALTQVNLPTSLETLGASAFATCPITSITVPASLESCHYIYPPFANCARLKTIRFAEGVTKIATGLFGDCSGLESIVIPEGVSVIDDNAFDGCENLKSVSLPSTLLSINKAAFANCPLLSGVVLPASLEVFGANAFADCDSITSITIPASLISCHNIYPPFSGCDGLTEVRFAEGVTHVATGLLSECPALVSVTVPEGVTAVDNYAFEDSVNLASVSLPPTLTSIGTAAFSGCTSLVSIAIPDSVNDIGANVFAGCSALTDVNVPVGVTAIDSGAFKACSALEAVVLPNRVTVIRASAFADCPNLEAVTIPRSVTSIQGSAFDNDDALTIYGVAGSYAETFANNKGIPFVAIEVATTSIVLSASEVTLEKKESVTVSADVLPIDATGEFVWTSADTSVATVDANGKITGKGGGVTTVTLTVGNMSASVRVTVLQPVTSVTLNMAVLEIEAGETFGLVATVKPTNATNPVVEWTSSDPSVATVDSSGLVTAVDVGTAVVTATATDGSGISASCTVMVTKDLSAATVEAADQTYTGEALEPDITVVLGGVTLDAGTDYDVAYSNNTEVGTATVIVTGKGFYTGEATGTFEIVAAAHAPGWAGENGGWYYYEDDGTLRKNEWIQIGKSWGYLGVDGKLVENGWAPAGSTWYYIKNYTVMKEGWASYGGNWYYIKNYSVMKEGWVVTSGKYFYIRNYSPVVNGWVTYNGKQYHFNASGVCDRVA